MASSQTVDTSQVDQVDLPEVSRHEEKEHIPIEDEKEPTNTTNSAQGHQLFAETDSNWHTVEAQLKKPRRGVFLSRKKLLWISLASILLIGAIVGGVVGGLISRKDNSSPKETSSASPDSAGGSPTSSISPAPSPVSTSAQTSATNLFNSSLASVAWADNEGLNYRRLYYQDSTGTIKEMAWNNSGDSWYASQDDLVKAKEGSPIAAAVAGNTTWPFQINICFLDPNGHLVERFTKDGKIWKQGMIGSADVIPSPQTKIALLWTQTDHSQCNNDCGEQTILYAYQESNNRITVYNNTVKGPQLTSLDANPVPGSGIAFQQVWHSSGTPCVRLFYESGENKLCSVNFKSAEATGDIADVAGKWTLHEESPIGDIVEGAQLASFTWGNNATTDGPYFERTLSSGPKGVGVDVFGLGGGSQPGIWHTENPDVMNNIQTYSALAANADRHVYAVEAGTVKEYALSIDGSWTLVGDVPIKN
ncbi:MAG: hypothetical protein Q9167_006028 [Letrouitia subvulpina]